MHHHRRMTFVLKSYRRMTFVLKSFEMEQNLLRLDEKLESVEFLKGNPGADSPA